MLIKYFLVYVLLTFLSLGCSSSGKNLRQGYSRKTTNRRYVSRKYDYRTNFRVNGNKLIKAINKWIGTPYCFGGSTKKCTDCSGFVQSVYKEVFGAKLPRTANQQYKHGKSIRRKLLKTGDLIFFRNWRYKITHVGIYIGNNKFAHASSSKGVMISSIKDPYFKKRYAGARRLF